MTLSRRWQGFAPFGSGPFPLPEPPILPPSALCPTPCCSPSALLSCVPLDAPCAPLKPLKLLEEGVGLLDLLQDQGDACWQWVPA